MPCAGETYVPSGATVSAVTNNSAVVHWDSVSDVSVLQCTALPP